MPNYEARAKILVDVVVNKGAIKQVFDQNTTRVIRDHSKSVEGLNFSYRKLAWTLVRTHIIIRTFYRAIEFGTLGLRKAIEAADKYKETLAGIAAVKTLYVSPFIKSAEELTRYYENAKLAVAGFYDQLTLLSAYTPLTADQLSKLVFILEAYGQTVDLTNEKVREGLLGLANAIATLTKGQQVEKQLLQEIRALMGDSNKQHAILLQTLEALGLVTDEQLKKWKEENTLLIHMAEILKAFNIAGRDLYKTWRGLTTTFSSKTAIVLRPAGLALLERLKERLEEIANRYLIVTEKETILTSKGEKLAKALYYTGEAAIDAADGFIKFAEAATLAVGKLSKLYLKLKEFMPHFLMAAGIVSLPEHPALGLSLMSASVGLVKEGFKKHLEKQSMFEPPKEKGKYVWSPVGGVDITNEKIKAKTVLDIFSAYLSGLHDWREKIKNEYEEIEENASNFIKRFSTQKPVNDLSDQFILLRRNIHSVSVELDSFYENFLTKTEKQNKQFEELVKKYKRGWETIFLNWKQFASTTEGTFYSLPMLEKGFIRQKPEEAIRIIEEKIKAIRAELMEISLEKEELTGTAQEYLIKNLEVEERILKNRMMSLQLLAESIKEQQKIGKRVPEIKKKLSEKEYLEKYLEKLKEEKKLQEERLRIHEQLSNMKARITEQLLPKELRELHAISIQWASYIQLIEESYEKLAINYEEFSDYTKLVNRWYDIQRNYAILTATGIKNVWDSLTQDLKSALEDFIYTFDFSWKKITDIFRKAAANMLAAWIEFQLKMAAYQFVQSHPSFLGSLTNFVSFLFRLNAPATTSTANAANATTNRLASTWDKLNFSLFSKHDGGYIPKYHWGGLANDEVLAILQKGEYVVSRKGVEFLDKINQGKLPIMGQQPIAVQVNIKNETGIPVQAKQQGVRFDGRQFVLDVILQNLHENGILRQAIREVVR